MHTGEPGELRDTANTGVLPLMAVRFFAGGGLALAFLGLPGALAPMAGALLPQRCAILAAFLLCAWIGTQGLRDRRRRSLLLLAGAAALALIALLAPVLSPWGALAAGLQSPAAGFAARLLLLLPVLLIPGAALGAASRGWLSRMGAAGDWRVDALHASTLAAGGALGSVAAFALVLPVWGDRGLLVAAALFLSIAALFQIPSERRAASAESTLPSFSRWGLTLWGFTAFGSLFAWERILALIYGPFPELPARVLALFLFGLTLGGLALLLWPLPKPSPLRLPLLSVLTGVAFALTVAGVNRFPLLFLSASLVPVGSTSFALRAWGIGALLVVPASLGLGAMLPILLGDGGENAAGKDGLREHDDGIAAASGGAVLSAAVVAFWGLPILGFQRWLLGLSALLLGFAALGFVRRSPGPRWARIAGILLCLGATLTFGSLLPRGDPRLLTTGVYRYAPEILKGFKSASFYRSERRKALLPYYREGAEATVAVESVLVDSDPVLAVTTDGTVSATSFYDLVPQVLSAELPLFVHPGSSAVFLAGYGTGVPAGSLLLHPLRSLDIAEGESAVVEASRQFEPMNRTPRTDPRVRIFTQDPQQLLRSKGRASYDIILMRPTAPEAAASRYLLTRGFFRLAASRLKPGGLFAQVVPLQGLSQQDVASVVQTLQASFRDVVVFQTYYQELLALASEKPIQFDLPAMRQMLSNERINSDLFRIGVKDPESLVVRYRVSGKGAAAFARSGRILEEGSAPLAWGPYRTGGQHEVTSIVEALNRTSTGLGNRIAPLPGGEEGNAVLLGLARSALSARDAVRAADLAESLLARKDVSNGHQVLGDAWYIQGEQLKAVEQWHASLQADPNNVNALMSLADFNSDRNNHSEAVQYLGRILAVHPDDPEALFARGRALYELKREKESEADLARALALKGEAGAPLSLYYLGLIQKNKGNLQGAAEFLRRYLQWGYRQGRLTPVEADVHFALADVYQGLKLSDLAQQQRKAGEALKQRLQQSAKNTREAVFEYLHKR